VVCADGVEIAVSQATFGALTGMPPSEDGIIYVVSALCAQAPELQGRMDVYAPGEAIRDATGKIIGAQGLSYIAPLATGYVGVSGHHYHCQTCANAMGELCEARQ
jgi:hypothetical protein